MRQQLLLILGTVYLTNIYVPGSFKTKMTLILEAILKSPTAVINTQNTNTVSLATKGPRHANNMDTF